MPSSPTTSTTTTSSKKSNGIGVNPKGSGNPDMLFGNDIGGATDIGFSGSTGIKGWIGVSRGCIAIIPGIQLIKEQNTCYL
jgi:hypothetical protein